MGIKRQEKNKKYRKGKKDEGDDFSSEPAKRNNNRREFAYQRAKLAMERNVNELMERRQANNDEHSVQPRMMRRRPAGHMNVGNARRMAERRGDASQAWNRRMNMCIEKPCEVHH